MRESPSAPTVGGALLEQLYWRSSVGIWVTVQINFLIRVRAFAVMVCFLLEVL